MAEGGADRTEVWPRLYVGGITADRDFDGVRLCVLEAPCDAGCRHLPAFRPSLEGDWQVNPILAEEAVRWLAAGLGEGRRTLVHCGSGIERSPAIAALYLVRYEGLSVRDAYATLLRTRPQVRVAPHLVPVDDDELRARRRPEALAHRSAEP